MDMDYSLPALDALSKGARFDARTIFAMELMKSQGFVTLLGGQQDGRPYDPDYVAKAALDFACALFSHSRERDLLKPLTTDTNIAPTERAHIVRNAQAQVLGQAAGAEAAREVQRSMSPVLVPATGRAN